MSGTKYKPVEVDSVYADEDNGGRSADPRATCTLALSLKLLAAVLIGLLVGLLVGGGNSVIVRCPQSSGSLVRCSAPVEGPERHLRPWDTLPMEMTSGGGDRGVGLPFAGRSAVLGQRGMAATSQPLVSMVAIDIMKRGGSAIDAAIAANLVQGLVEPMSNGIGGDVFAIIYDPKKKKLVGYNGSGRSSKTFGLRQMREAAARVAASESGGDATGDDDGQVETYIPGQGPLSVSVPGAVQGFCDMHEKYGKLPWSELFGPAIEYALRGFPVTEYIGDRYARGWGRAVSTDDGCSNQRTLGGVHPHACDGFYNTFTKGKSSAPGNRGPEYGELFSNPELAETYATIRDGGCAAFYNGSVARKIFASGWAESVGLPLTQEDFSSHRGDWIHENRSAGYRLLNTTYKERYRVFELPPNPGGLATLEMLNIMEELDVGSMGFNTADYLHASIEAKKLAWADRAEFYADPDRHNAVGSDELGEIWEVLASKEYGRRQAERVDMTRAATEVGKGTPMEQAVTVNKGEGDTIYAAFADSDGMMVSWIQSNFAGFGSKIAAPGTGFALQNRGSLFALQPDDHPNIYQPGKRPFHTIIPAFALRDEKPWLAFGVMGGDFQSQGQCQTFLNQVEFGMNPQEAGDAARWSHGGSQQPTGTPMDASGTITLETGVCEEVREELRRRGHTIRRAGPSTYGGYQCIRREEQDGQVVYHGGTEMRKDGMVHSY